MTFSKRSKVVLGTLLAAWIPVLVVCEPAILRSIKMRLRDTRYIDSSGRPLKTFFAGLQPQPGIRGRRPQGRRQQAPQCTNHSGTFWRVMDALGLEDIVFAQSGCTPTTCGGCDDYVYELPCPGGCTGGYYNSWYEDVTAGLTEGYKQNNTTIYCSGCNAKYCDIIQCTNITCGCVSYGNPCAYNSDCCNPYLCSNQTHKCQQAGGAGSPIVLDPFNEGFHLTSLAGGVRFTVLPGGPLQQMSWTDANWHNGWLALDRNGNGTIDNFTELFGNYTAQPPSNDPNGFLALAVFDDPANGGNGNGFIDPGDSVYSRLLVWIDANHNGYSEPNELHTLPSLGISKIGLTYRETPFVDQYGNHFRYRGSVWDQGGNERDSCYDVFLQIQPN